MGQHAEDIIEGRQCSWCGVFFEEAHGYPVVCKGCAKSEDYDPKNDPPVATEKEL